MLKLVYYNGEFCLFLGVNSFMRKIAKALNSTTQLTTSMNGRYVLQTTAMKSLVAKTVEFSPNEEFEEKTM